jgi:hypothetical protein
MSDDHRYSACRDEHCPRPLCVAYKEGYGDGYEDAILTAQAGQ